MFRKRRDIIPLNEREPLRVMFMINDMSVGGAEMLLDQIIRRMDRMQFSPELCCLHQLGELGEKLRGEAPVFSNLLKHKYDVPVLSRLVQLLRQRRSDAVVTVGAGDRMFWGRLAAWRAGVPVVVAALHSTGWPDRIGRLNRMLTPLTDAFVGVAAAHGRFLVERERFPAERVYVVPNGVDTQKYHPQQRNLALCDSLGIDRVAKVVGLIAVLRPEKNHALLLRAAAQVRKQIPGVRFVLVGDGPERSLLEQMTEDLGLKDVVLFLGARSDVPELLSLFDVFALTSKIEASPVSILEAQACGIPVVATNVGSISESVIDGQTGLLAESESVASVASAVVRILQSPELASSLSCAAREFVVEHRSIKRMVRGYEELIARLYEEKIQRPECPRPAA